MSYHNRDLRLAIGNATVKVGDDMRNFPDFVRWCLARWQPGATLEKIDPEAPWAPDNAYWEGGLDPDGWSEIWSQGYAKTRAPTSDPCPTCRLDSVCVKFCPRKAKYWDLVMRKIKRKLGV